MIKTILDKHFLFNCKITILCKIQCRIKISIQAICKSNKIIVVSGHIHKIKVKSYDGLDISNLLHKYSIIKIDNIKQVAENKISSGFKIDKKSKREKQKKLLLL